MFDLTPKISLARRVWRVLISALALGALQSATQAAEVTLSNPSETDFRAAIEAANRTPEADTISFASVAFEVELTQALPEIVGTLTIDTQPGAAEVRIVCQQTLDKFRFFTVPLGANLTLRNLDLAGAYFSESGGAVDNRGTLQLSNCRLRQHGGASNGGAITNFGGTVNVSHCTFLLNGTVENGRGAAILNSNGNDKTGVLVVSQSIFSTNGGGVTGAIANEGDLFVTRSTFDNNAAYSNSSSTIGGGGAIYNEGNADIVHCTLTRNSSHRNGGAIYNVGTLRLFSSTLTQNNAGGAGNDVYHEGNSTIVGNSIFGTRGVGFNYEAVGPGAQSAGFNLCVTSNDILNQDTDLVRTEPNFESDSPADNGGPTPTLALRPDSPAIDKGNSADIAQFGAPVTTASTDQRGERRIFDRPYVTNAGGGNGSDIGAFEVQNRAPETFGGTYSLRVGQPFWLFLPSSDSDGQNLSYEFEDGSSLPPGLSFNNGIFGTPTTTDRGFTTRIRVSEPPDPNRFESSNVLTFIIEEAGSLVVNTNGDSDDFDSKTSLANAIDFANEDDFFSAITFDLPTDHTIVLTQPLPELQTFLSISGPTNSVGVTVMRSSAEGTPAFRIFTARRSPVVELNNLTISGGREDFGGGIANIGAGLTVRGCTISGNQAAVGGGFYNGVSLDDSEEFTRLINCTVAGNQATGHFSSMGGGIYNGLGRLTVEACTIVGNRAPLDRGAGLYSSINSVVNVEVGNSIIAGNLSDAVGSTPNLDVQIQTQESFALVSNGFNLIGDGINRVIDGSSFNEIPISEAFKAEGDQTGIADDALKLGRLADNGGPTQTIALALDSPARNAGNTTIRFDQRGVERPQEGVADIGAFEFNTPLSESLVVTTTRDEDNRTSDPGYGSGTSLREAMSYANRDGVSSEISFDPAVFGASRQTIRLSGSRLPSVNIGQRLNITAPSVGVGISGSGRFNIFNIGADSIVTLTNLYLSDAVTTDSAGGAINNAGALTVVNCTFARNKAVRGGAIYTNGDLERNKLTIRNSTFSSNVAQLSGGALNNSHGLTTLDSCTFVDNSVTGAGAVGGGVATYGNAQTRTEIRNSVLVNNVGGDVDIYNGSTLSSVSKGTNLVGAGSAISAFNGSGDLTGMTKLGLRLIKLSNNGGPVPTVAPRVGSLAINGGSTDLKTDARGILRPQGKSDDVGAFEVVVTPDSIVPVLSFLKPVVGSVTPLSTFGTTSITGTATDNVGVSQVWVRLSRVRGSVTQYWNGREFGAAKVYVLVPLEFAGAKQVGWRWKAMLPTPTDLDAGIYVIEAFARDLAGNPSTTQRRSFTLAASAPIAATQSEDSQASELMEAAPSAPASSSANAF